MFSLCYKKKEQKLVSAGEDDEEKELLYSACGNIK
jgi:hypothetical protein